MPAKKTNYDLKEVVKFKLFRKILGDDFIPTTKQINEFNNLVANHGWQHNFSIRVANFIKYDLDDYAGRFEKTRNNHRGITEAHHKNLYGEVEGKKRWEQYCSK